MRRFLATGVLVLCSTVLAEDQAVIDMGGTRKVVATVTKAKDWYKVRISLTPVSCFDAGMNKRLSSEKARSYANEALFRYLGGNRRRSGKVSHAEILESGMVDSRYVLVMRVPHDGVCLKKAAEEKPTVQPQEMTARSASIESKDDYQETLEAITNALSEEPLKFKGNLSDFYKAISDAEELGVARLTSLGVEIKADRWLLDIEREELLRAIATSEEQFLKRLRKQVEEVEGSTKGED